MLYALRTYLCSRLFWFAYLAAPSKNDFKVLLLDVINLDRQFYHWTDSVEKRLTALETQGGIMTSFAEDTQAQIAQIKADIAAERAEVQGKIGTLAGQVSMLTQQVSDLQNQIAQGGQITPEQMAAIKSGLEDVDAGIKDISEAVPAAPPSTPAS